MRDRGDRTTRELFAWEPPQVGVGYGEDVAGRGPLGNRVARVVSRALRDAADDGHPRSEIAASLSAELGRKVSKDMLDKWASEAAEGHFIPLDAFIALIRVTGADELLGFIPNLFGFAVVERKYEAIIELALLEEHEREVAELKTRITQRLRHGR